MSLDWQTLLGPFGLAIAAVVAVVVLWRRLLGAQAEAQAQLAKVYEELAREHEARLLDAKQYTEALLRITESTHAVIDRLSESKTLPVPRIGTYQNQRG